MSSTTAKILLFVGTAIAVIAIAYSYITPSANLGDFSKFPPNSEINQTINVVVDTTKRMQMDASGNVTMFYAKDKNDAVRVIESHDPVPAGVLKGGVIELLGHMHGDVFAATRISPVK
jgi:hypothetical protein